MGNVSLKTCDKPYQLVVSDHKNVKNTKRAICGAKNMFPGRNMRIFITSGNCRDEHTNNGVFKYRISNKGGLEVWAKYVDIPDGGDSSTLGSGAGVCDTSTKGEKCEIETESQEIVKEKILIPGYKIMMPRNLSAGEIFFLKSKEV